MENIITRKYAKQLLRSGYKLSGYSVTAKITCENSVKHVRVIEIVDTETEPATYKRYIAN